MTKTKMNLEFHPVLVTVELDFPDFCFFVFSELVFNSPI